jgi:hypothetical protein
MRASYEHIPSQLAQESFTRFRIAGFSHRVAWQRISRNGAGRCATGIRRKPGLLQEWPKDGPKLLWQTTNVLGGYSTPSVGG